MRQARVHGGALGAAIVRWGGARSDWLDLSTGINPCPPAMPPLAPDIWERLPESEAENELRAIARRFYGAPPGASVVIAPGTQSLISLVPHLFAPGIAVVVSPTYGEHERALIEAGHAVRAISDLDDVPPEARLLVVVNPNNPDARRFSREHLLDLATRMARRGGLLVVDEAFMDADPRESVATDTGGEGLLVLRSFGKFFGLAGLRLGFALSEPKLASRIEARLGPWAVSGPALGVASELLHDETLTARLRAETLRQSEVLSRTLRGAGLSIEGSTRLFALVRHANAGPLFEALAARRVLARPFTQRPDWLRFGNLRGQPEAERLGGALREALADSSA